MIPKLFFCLFSGFRCWDSELFDINDELAQIANKADLGEEGPNGKGFFPHFEVIDIFRVHRNAPGRGQLKTSILRRT